MVVLHKIVAKGNKTVVNYHVSHCFVTPVVKKKKSKKEALESEKDVKLKVAAKNGCDDSLIAKILIITIQVNLVLNPSETWRRKHKFA